MRRIDRLRPILIPSVVLVVALSLAACVAPAPPAPPTAAPGIPGPLVDTRWVVTSLAGAAPAVYATGAPLTLQFGGRDTVAGSGGCTSFRGAASGDGVRLALGPLTAGTASCGDAVDRQERAYLALLQAATGYTLANDELILLDSAGKALVGLSKVGE